jgi:hypothetical protein
MAVTEIPLPATMQQAAVALVAVYRSTHAAVIRTSRYLRLEAMAAVISMVVPVIPIEPGMGLAVVVAAVLYIPTEHSMQPLQSVVDQPALQIVHWALPRMAPLSVQGVYRLQAPLWPFHLVVWFYP